MLVITTIATHWIVEVPTGDSEMPWISLGPLFQTEEAAKKDLMGWRQELQDVARIRQHTHETFTAHQA